jgi:hypothetical protein
MLVDERLCRITEKKLRHDEQPNIFLTVESFLQNVTSITIHREFDNTTSKCQQSATTEERVTTFTNLMHDTIFLRSSATDAASRHLCTAQFPNLSQYTNIWLSRT